MNGHIVRTVSLHFIFFSRSLIPIKYIRIFTAVEEKFYYYLYTLTMNSLDNYLHKKITSARTDVYSITGNLQERTKVSVSPTNFSKINPLCTSIF